MLKYTSKIFILDNSNISSCQKIDSLSTQLMSAIFIEA
jgi:hypothetical protein